MQFISKMNAITRELEKYGYSVEQPKSAEAGVYIEAEAKGKTVELKRGFIDDHFAKIDQSEAILVVNETKNGIANYIGGNTLMEMTYAFSSGLDIYLLNDIPTDVSYALEIEAFMPVVLHGEVSRLCNHVAQLPRVLVASSLPFRHTTAGRGFRRAGIPVQTIDTQSASGATKLPRSIEQTYESALNHHRVAKEAADDQEPDYYVTIESGLHSICKNHATYGCSAIVIEKNGFVPKIGVDIDVEIPKSITDKVSSIYTDVDTLIQQELNSAYKGISPFLTNHSLPRARILEEAVYRTLAKYELYEL